MDLQNYDRLKLKYKLYFAMITLSAFALSLYPTWYIISEVATFINFDIDAPVRKQENSLVFLAGCFILFVVNLGIACIALTYLICKFKKWSKQQAIDYFYHYKNLPKHWLKR
jgi:hypothetical protein